MSRACDATVEMLGWMTQESKSRSVSVRSILEYTVYYYKYAIEH